MKRRQTIILLAVLALTGASPLRAQYFDWVRTYQSTHSSGTGSPDLDNMVLDMDADSRGNVYFVGRCVRGAAINGEELLEMVNSHDPPAQPYKPRHRQDVAPRGDGVAQGSQRLGIGCWLWKTLGGGRYIRGVLCRIK